MRAFQRENAGVVALFNADEAAIIRNLAAQVAGMVGAGANGSAGQKLDPALARLFPDAYPEDAEASAEFRKFTSRGLATRKAENADSVIRSLDTADELGAVRLDAADAAAWLRSLTDMRLTLAARLGIEREDQPPADSVMQDVYDWLGFIQNSLVEALQR